MAYFTNLWVTWVLRQTSSEELIWCCKKSVVRPWWSASARTASAFDVLLTSRCEWLNIQAVRCSAWLPCCPPCGSVTGGMGANHKCVSLRAKTHLDVHTATAVMVSEPFRTDLPWLRASVQLFQNGCWANQHDSCHRWFWFRKQVVLWQSSFGWKTTHFVRERERGGETETYSHSCICKGHSPPSTSFYRLEEYMKHDRWGCVTKLRQ